jgi:hypothetical protein
VKAEIFCVARVMPYLLIPPIMLPTPTKKNGKSVRSINLFLAKGIQ